MAGILVTPPIVANEFFNAVILGRDGHGVGLSQVATTSDVTLFVAGSDLNSAKDRASAIYNIADRIKRLANAPEKVVDLIDENPFPKEIK